MADEPDRPRPYDALIRALRMGAGALRASNTPLVNLPGDALVLGGKTLGYPPEQTRRAIAPLPSTETPEARAISQWRDLLERR